MRARNLKPGIFKNELLAVANPLFTVIFEGLWCLADRDGRIEDRPARIHMEINAGRAFETTVESLAWLTENGFIARYRVGKLALIQVINFRKHQNPHHAEKASGLPPMDQAETSVKPDANPGQASGSRPAQDPPTVLIPDSGFLIPDSGSLTADTRRPGDDADAHAAFERVMAKYPPNPIRDSRIAAEHAARRLVTSGQATWDELEAGAERYAKARAADGLTVMNPKNFFEAADLPWRQAWPVQQPPARQVRGGLTPDAESWKPQEYRDAG